MTTSAGFAKIDITAWEPELAMMGWGRMDNRIVGVAEPLFARAMAIHVQRRTFYYVCIELMAVSQAIRDEVLARLDREHGDLGIQPEDVMLTATHTHSAPSGYSHYFFINLNGPGFSPRVFESAVDGTVASIVEAHRNLQDCELEVATGAMPLKEAVAFNRSWFAYNENEDVEPVTEDRRDEALDRQMTVLVAKRGDHPLGCVSWFPVHCTSVHAENDHVHCDNKGLAAADLEREMGDDFVAIFAQEASGDVSPNFRYDAKRKKVVGRFDDDYASAQFNADAQRRLTKDLMEGASKTRFDAIETNFAHIDFSDIRVAEEFAHGREKAVTTIGTLGISMAEGTAEGPGPILGLKRFNRWLTRRKLNRGVDDPKIPMIDVGNGLDARFLGRFSVRKFRIPRLDPTFGYIKDQVRDGLDEAPWIAQVVGLQLARIGPILIVGVPFELTTVAGRRTRAMLARHFEDVEHIIIGSYTNEYAGYCTTFEEYRVQHYEAGYTLFGPHQLGALMTVLDEMARALPGPIQDRATPHEFDPEALARREFDEPWPVPRAKPTW